MMDYRKLLVQYMKAVYQAEGVCFSDCTKGLTLEEDLELQTIAEDLVPDGFYSHTQPPAWAHEE